MNRSTLKNAAIAAIATVALAACGKTGTVTPGGKYGATHAGDEKRPWAHRGVDFMIARGAKVIAPADGTVMLAIKTVEKADRKRWSCGAELRITHTGQAKGIKTRYCHLGKIFVDFGATVRAGDVIATVGVCGQGLHHCADHLHFETVDYYVETDPETLISDCFSKGEGALSEERPLYHPLKC